MNNTKILHILASTVLVLASVLVTSDVLAQTGKIWYVKPGGAGAKDCSIWENACDLQAALTSPTLTAGDQVWVAVGSYKPTTDNVRTKSFVLKEGVMLYGGFAGDESSLDARGDWKVDHPTYLTGELQGDANLANNSIHVVTATNLTRAAGLDGFYIESGNANGSYADAWGGGMYALNSGFIIRNTIFRNNQAVSGGGMFIDGKHAIEGTSPDLENVTFEYNTVTANGGGLHSYRGASPEFTQVVFTANKAANGGGMWSEVVTTSLSNVTFHDNEATQSGGGMYARAGTHTLTTVHFEGNKATLDGGGLCIAQGVVTTLEDPTFTGNQASRHGGGLYNYNANTVLNDATFEQNKALGGDGGGLAHSSGSTVTIMTGAFTGNTASASGGGLMNYAANVRLDDVTFTGNEAGTFGGGLNNWTATASLSRVTFTGNHANLAGGGILNQSSTTVLVNGSFLGNSADDQGGGIRGYAGTTTLSNVVFSGNSAVNWGGGMHNHQGTQYIYNTTFFGNSAGNGGGGGMRSDGSTTHLRNTIFWDNKITGTGFGPQISRNAGTATIYYCDIQDAYSSTMIWDTALGTNNGGNIDADPVFNDPDGADNLPGTSDDDLRLHLDSAAVDMGGNDHRGQDVLDVDNNGNKTELTPLDRDGAPRVRYSRIDMGAYEFDYPAFPSVIYVDQSASGARTGESWANALKNLYFAFHWARARAGDVRIWVAEGRYTPTPGTDRAASFELRNGLSMYGCYSEGGGPVNCEIHNTILSGDLFGNDGPGFANRTDNSIRVMTGADLDGSPVLSNFTISGGYNTNAGIPGEWGGGMYLISSSLSIKYATITDNYANAGGGMFIYGKSSLGFSPQLRDVVFSGNYAAVNGGGLHTHNNTSPTLTNVQFTSNHAVHNGGGMYHLSSGASLSNVTFTDNKADRDGGGMFNTGSSASLDTVTFRTNAAGTNPVHGHGGGMANFTSTVTLIRTYFYYNQTQEGGGMYNDRSTVTLDEPVVFIGNGDVNGGGMYNLQSSPKLTGVTFEQNMTYDDGGGMYNYESSPVLDHVIFRMNGCQYDCAYPYTRNAGGMYNYRSNPTLTDVTFDGNAANRDAGGMYNQNSSPVLTRVTFTGNIATGTGSATTGYGGGMFNNASSPTMDTVTFQNNSARLDGGGIYNTNSNPTLTDSTITENGAGRNGGGIANAGGGITLVGGTIKSNESTASGGGMYSSDSDVLVRGVTFESNQATQNGGGMYTRNDLGSGTTGPGPKILNTWFISNQAMGNGGAMSNYTCSTNPPVVTQTIFLSNSAVMGGAVYNEGCSSKFTNVTISKNTAQYGGGMSNYTTSTPTLTNSIVWGNQADGNYDQIEDNPPSPAKIISTSCLVEGNYGNCMVKDTHTPFVDITASPPDLRLRVGSEAIDNGVSADLPPDTYNLDGDTDTLEKLSQDISGAHRCYADNDMDGAVDGDPDSTGPLNEPCALNKVDLGAYEAGCAAWHIHDGDKKLKDGQKYRQDYHAEIGSVPSLITVDMTLASYAAQESETKLTNSRRVYNLVFGCGVDPNHETPATVDEKSEAIIGVENATWELATGAMLRGNEKMVQALDLADQDDINAEIDLLTGTDTDEHGAIPLYNEAVDGYYSLLSGDQFPGFLESQPHRIDPLTVDPDTGEGQESPFLDVKRMAMAMAKRSRASLELAERLSRKGSVGEADGILRSARVRADMDLTLLGTLWDQIHNDVSYKELLRSMSDMDRLLNFFAEGKNALGYSPEWVPIHYKWNDPDHDNNYEETNDLAGEKVTSAISAVNLASTESQKVDDTYRVMEQRYNDILTKYDTDLRELCGPVSSTDNTPDLSGCRKGTISVQISAVNQAQLRLMRVVEDMNTLNRRIDLEVQTRAKAAGIYDYTADLMDPATSEKYSTLMDQQKTVSQGTKIAKGIGGILSGMVSGASSGSAFGPWGAVAGGLFGAISPAADMYSSLSGEGEGPSKEELLAEFQVWQNAQMIICDGKIKDLEFEKRVKELYLEFGGLNIDYMIALENLQQELLRLQAMTTRVEYLQAEKTRALAFTQLLYQDPAHRVLRDYYMEEAQRSYDTALAYVFESGRAMEYEANQTAQELIAPDPDTLLAVRNINTLGSRRADIKTAYDNWVEGKTWVTYVTDDPYPPVRLSRALGYQLTEIPGVGWVTPQEQFNAYVVRNPENRYGDEKSLYFTFPTSIAEGNPFFSKCIYNDRIVSVKMRLRGQDLGQSSAVVRLGWGDARCSGTECGTTFIRSEKAFYEPLGCTSGSCVDDLRPYAVRPYLATISAVTGSTPFPPSAENPELATRSVQNSTWTVFIDMTDPGNADLKVDNIDEIELIITHEAITLQAPICVAPGALDLPPLPAYQPMKKVLYPQSSPLAAASRMQIRQSAVTTNLAGFYAGSVVVDEALYMPSFDLNLRIDSADGGMLNGNIDAAKGLHFPLDEVTGKGPAVSGTWDATSFGLHTTGPFESVLDPERTVERTVELYEGVITQDGEVLTGKYRETITHLTPNPVVITGTFTLWRIPQDLPPAVNFTAIPAAGPAPLTVAFTDLSGGATSWRWTFGDGDMSTEQHPTHIYTQDGAYDVTLTATNAAGSSTLVLRDYVVVGAGGKRIYLPAVIH